MSMSMCMCVCVCMIVCVLIFCVLIVCVLILCANCESLDLLYSYNNATIACIPYLMHNINFLPLCLLTQVYCLIVGVVQEKIFFFYFVFLS